MEICVNEYIRTDSGELFKVIDVEKGSVKIKSDYREWIGMCCIKNHSKNIIDLIEVGDYVNGHEVHKYNGNLGIISINELGWTFIAFKDKDYPIQTIVTKEAYASMEYKIEEDK